MVKRRGRAAAEEFSFTQFLGVTHRSATRRQHKGVCTNNLQVGNSRGGKVNVAAAGLRELRYSNGNNNNNSQFLQKNHRKECVLLEARLGVSDSSFRSALSDPDTADKRLKGPGNPTVQERIGG